MDMPEFSRMIEEVLTDARATVTGDGSKFEAVVVSEAFEGLSTVKRHQRVYRIFSEQLASGAMHALTIKAYTPTEWDAAHNR